MPIIRRKAITPAPLPVVKTGAGPKKRAVAGAAKPIYLPRPEDDNRTDYKEVVARYMAKIKNPKSAIRAKCVECSGGSLKEVQLCPVTSCALHAFRMGKNPFHKKTLDRLAAQEGGEPDEEDDDEDDESGGDAE